MNINRIELLKKLKEAAVGLTGKPILEQSDCYVFSKGQLITFNDEIMVRAKSPLDPAIELAVNAADFTAVLAKFPDDEVEVVPSKGELHVKGKRRTAGISCAAEIVLPFSDVPAATKWTKLPDEVSSVLQQAARTCGQDASQFLTTCVHITGELVEACDNIRFYRATLPTRFPSDTLIPASSISSLDGLGLAKVSMEHKGWVHFQLASGTEITLRCSAEKYHEGIEALLEMKNSESVELPSNLGEMLDRCDVMIEGGHDARVQVTVQDSEITVAARKASGWYRERKKIRHQGRGLSFEINPKFLSEVLARTHTVAVDSKKLKIEVGNVHFVVSLSLPEVVKESEEA